MKRLLEKIKQWIRRAFGGSEPKQRELGAGVETGRPIVSGDRVYVRDPNGQIRRVI